MQTLKDNHMISVGCPNCAKLYQIPETALGDKGRTMKCKACGEKWFCTKDHIQTPYENETPVLNTPKVEVLQENDPWNTPTPEEKIEDSLSQDKALAITIANSAIENSEIENENPFEVSNIKSLALEKAKQKSFKIHKFDELTGSNEDLNSQAEVLLSAQREKRKQDIKKLILKPNILAAIASGMICFLFLALPSVFVGLNPSYAILYKSLGYTINTQGLAIDNILSRLESDKAGTYLKIEGDITNITQEAKSIPRIKLYAKNKAGAEIYSWVISPTKPSLVAGETIRFKTNYAEPSLDAAQLEVRFFTGISTKK